MKIILLEKNEVKSVIAYVYHSAILSRGLKEYLWGEEK
jgi:hypothetical protein